MAMAQIVDHFILPEQGAVCVDFIAYNHEQNSWQEETMRRICPSMSGLLAFEAAARHLNFSRAADELCVTQGAVSRQIKLLEQFLGAALFHRVRRGLVLTEAGRFYLDRIPGLLDQIQAATNELLTHKGASNEITLLVPPTIATRWFIPLLPDFRRRLPQWTIQFALHYLDYQTHMHKVDAALFHGDGTWPRSVSTYLFGRELVALASPKLNLGKSSDLAGLTRYPLLQHIGVPYAWREWFTSMSAATTHAFEGPRLDNYAAILQAAEAELGLAVVPLVLAQEEIAAGRLVVLFDHIAHSEYAYYLAVPEEKAQAQKILEFSSWLVGHARKAAAATATLTPPRIRQGRSRSK
jgi:LysR family glycine cleavage system transcriptional activator